MKIEFNHFQENEKLEALALAYAFGKEYQYSSINVSFTNNMKVGKNSFQKGWTPEKVLEVRSDGLDKMDNFTNNLTFAVSMADALNCQTFVYHNQFVTHIKVDEAKLVVKENAVEAFVNEQVFQKYADKSGLTMAPEC